MKVILSEEQLKKVLYCAALNEEETAVTDAAHSAVVNDPIKNIRDANDTMNSILAAPFNNDNDYTDPMPDGQIAYGDDMRSVYNSNIGANQNWLNSVKNTFKRYKSQFGNEYDQTATVGKDRADCSGFVYSALRDAGYKVGVGNTDTMVNSPSFTNAISGGFRRITWRGPADAKKLPPGTILAYGAGENGKKYGHTLILGNNGTSYDYGKNNHTEYSPNLRQTYTSAWVPIG